MALLIDTAVVPARERLDFWSESSCSSYHPVQIRHAAGEEFWARMWGYELGPLSIFRIAAASNTMIRTSRAIAAGDPECVHVEVILCGQVNAAQGWRTGVARAGDILSYETSEPALVRADRPFASIVIRIPRELLGTQAQEICNLTAVRISGSDRLPRATVTFLCTLVRGLEAGVVPRHDPSNLAGGAVGLVQALYAARRGVHEPERLRSRAEILLSVESFIEANLGDPDLAPEQIARASFISTRYLHRLFESEGTSVCRWIRTSRLERCRRDLGDPALAHHTIVAIARRWGLRGPEQFSRLFRVEYGCSASEFRREAHSAAQTD